MKYPPKPKFKVGELVVYVEDEVKYYSPVKSITWKNLPCVFYPPDRWAITLENDMWNHHSWFRKLNKRELGK
jgi:hypothetical protein